MSPSSIPALRIVLFALTHASITGFTIGSLGLLDSSLGSTLLGIDALDLNFAGAPLSYCPLSIVRSCPVTIHARSTSLLTARRVVTTIRALAWSCTPLSLCSGTIRARLSMHTDAKRADGRRVGASFCRVGRRCAGCAPGSTWLDFRCSGSVGAALALCISYVSRRAELARPTYI